MSYKVASSPSGQVALKPRRLDAGATKNTSTNIWYVFSVYFISSIGTMRTRTNTTISMSKGSKQSAGGMENGHHSLFPIKLVL